jgi:hypothetical protein
MECRNCGRPLASDQGSRCPHCIEQQNKKKGWLATLGGGLVLVAGGVVWLVNKIRGHSGQPSA